MHSAGLELAKLIYTRLEVNLIRHRGDRSYPVISHTASDERGRRLLFEWQGGKGDFQQFNQDAYTYVCMHIIQFGAFFYIFLVFFPHNTYFYFPASGQAVDIGRCRPFPPPVFAFYFFVDCA